MVNKLVNELAICGMKAVQAAAEVHPDTINRLFLREDRLPDFTGICKQLAARKRPYKITGNEELEKICKTMHHQGVVAMIVRPEIQPLTREDLDAWVENGKTGLVLHSIGNDHNLGAIIRAAAFFEAAYVVVSDKEKESALTTSAYRIAEGGAEYLEIRSVLRTEAFLREAAEKLLVVGTSVRARRRVGELRSVIAEESARRRRRTAVALVLGNEEAGLPPVVEDACSLLLRIPGSGNIESLNVAQAAAIFLREAFE
ncbi:MAG: RNA methyltransferase [Spirochaetaceae bacterium]|jgi:TrmH RNA methyltransferase|nr:RNA methyltransferase [Spirochaetaceae bacterium]